MLFWVHTFKNCDKNCGSPGLFRSYSVKCKQQSQWTLCIIGSHVFEPCPPFWLCYQPWLLRTPSAAFMFNLTRVQTLWARFLLLDGWKRVPRTWQSTREPSCSWLLGEPLFFFIFSVSQPGLLALEGLLAAMARGVSVSLTIGGVTRWCCVPGCNEIKLEDARRMKFRGLRRRAPCRRLSGWIAQHRDRSGSPSQLLWDLGFCMHMCTVALCAPA